MGSEKQHGASVNIDTTGVNTADNNMACREKKSIDMKELVKIQDRESKCGE